jgi:hypothetical protein
MGYRILLIVLRARDIYQMQGTGSRYRQSGHLNKRQVSSCCQAALLSEELGRPLNLYVVIDLRHTDVGAESASHVFERVRSGHFVRWMARKRPGCPPLFVWTIETAGSSAHINWLVHIPIDLQAEFETKLERWFKRSTGTQHVAPTAIDIQPIGLTATKGSGLMTLVRYVCKGVHPSVAARMHIRPVDQGITVGKRSGVSRSLGKAAIKRRRTAGFPKPVRGWQAGGNAPLSLSSVEQPAQFLGPSYAEANIRGYHEAAAVRIFSAGRRGGDATRR